MKDKIIKAIENNIKAHPIAIEYTADEILALFDVSQQRELLKAFGGYLANEYPNSKPIYLEDIELFLNSL